ncbi:MAG: DNA-3-methyladenine glycosylase I [Terriglobia bacterium]
MKNRCQWCQNESLLVPYHDNEWGVPVHNDRRLFEMLILEGAQAGLSWLTILKKRENYRKAFHYFDYEAIAKYSQNDVERLLAEPGIVRNRLKIEAVIKNARGVLGIREGFGSLDSFLWRYTNGVARHNKWKSMAQLPASTAESAEMSKDLKKHGFNFVGPTICYSFMQAVGMVNDHTTNCFRYEQILALPQQKSGWQD